jgi:hypothetical protein
VLEQLRRRVARAEPRRLGRTTVLAHLGPPPCWTSDIRKLCEAPDAVREPYGAVSSTPPRFMTKSPISEGAQLNYSLRVTVVVR